MKLPTPLLDALYQEMSLITSAKNGWELSATELLKDCRNRLANLETPRDNLPGNMALVGLLCASIAAIDARGSR